MSYGIQDRSAPGFWIALQTQSGPRRILTGNVRGIGTPVPEQAANVLSFEFTDSERKSDVLKLTVDNYNLHHFDDPVWKRGNLIVVGWGYDGRESPARELVITKVTGSTTLTIEAKSKAVFMDGIVRNRTFTNMKRSDVVSMIATEHGFGLTQIEDTEVVYPSIVQVRKTDAQFIRFLAEREGFQFFVDFNGLHFHRRLTGSRPARLYRWFTDQFQGDVISFDVESDITQKPAGVQVAAHDPDTGEVVQATVTEGGADQLAPQYVTVVQENRRFIWPRDIPSSRAGARPPLDVNGESRRTLPNEDVLAGLYAEDVPPEPTESVDPAHRAQIPTPRQAEQVSRSRRGVNEEVLEQLYGTEDSPPTDQSLPQPDPTSDRESRPTPTQTVTGQEPLAVGVNQENRRWAAIPPVSADTPADGGVTVQSDCRCTSSGNPRAAVREAQAARDRSRHRAIKMSLTCVGDPMQFAKTVVQLEGFGRFLSIRYFVKEVVHTINASGYTMKLSCVSDGVGGHSTRSEVAPGLEFGEGPNAPNSNQQNCECPDPIAENQRVVEELLREERPPAPPDYSMGQSGGDTRTGQQVINELVLSERTRTGAPISPQSYRPMPEMQPVNVVPREQE